MSAILSADDLNDFISPGVACIKPVETLPQQKPTSDNPYEVTTEDKIPGESPPAQISLTDCLACSGCVTSAEAVLVSLQSHGEVLNALDSAPGFLPDEISRLANEDIHISHTVQDGNSPEKQKLFVASVSPQVRASIAATYGTTEKEAGWMIEQLLSGPQGIALGGRYGNRFSWVFDTNAMREVALVIGAEEVLDSSIDSATKMPILSSACPGWVCYAEKTHPHVLPHLSKLKSPQALTGTLLKTVISKKLGIAPDQIWHLAIMPCFDKKLEGSRQELTSQSWQSDTELRGSDPVRDVDCVLTAREILMLADSRNVSFPGLPRQPLSPQHIPVFPDIVTSEFFFNPTKIAKRRKNTPDAGTSGGFLYHTLKTQQRRNPGSKLEITRGRNADVLEYTISKDASIIFRAARFYGFRNIQNLVRKLKPAKINRLPGNKSVGARKPRNTGTAPNDYSYVEVMACPGGCTNGGGQIKFDDLGPLQSNVTEAKTHKEWLALVDEAYYSMDESDEALLRKEEMLEDQDTVDGISKLEVKKLVHHWHSITNIPTESLLFTSFREVHSDVGKPAKGDNERVAEIATKIAGGW
jgi:iron only hydrogenase large subunit-like protein